MSLGRGAVEVQHRELKSVQIGTGIWYWLFGQLGVGVSRGIVGLDMLCYANEQRTDGAVCVHSGESTIWREWVMTTKQLYPCITQQ